MMTVPNTLLNNKSAICGWFYSLDNFLRAIIIQESILGIVVSELGDYLSMKHDVSEHF